MPARSRKARLGDEFEAAYEQEFAFVWRMLLHFGVPEAQVEDAAQEVFLVVHRRLDTWDRSVGLRSWLYGICRRVAASHRRSRSRHERKLEALPTRSREPALEGRVGDRQLLAVLERALAELDPGPREAFVLSELEGMTAREIADATGVNPNTIASRVRKARGRLAAALERIAGEPSEGERHGRTR